MAGTGPYYHSLNNMDDRKLKLSGASHAETVYNSDVNNPDWVSGSLSPGVGTYEYYIDAMDAGNIDVDIEALDTSKNVTAKISKPVDQGDDSWKFNIVYAQSSPTTATFRLMYRGVNKSAGTYGPWAYKTVSFNGQ